MHDGEHQSLYELHQVAWASAHLPFHVALILLVEGINQFVIWIRILETVMMSTRQLFDISNKLPETFNSEDISKALGEIIYPFLKKYPPSDVLDTYEDVDEVLAEIRGFPAKLWTDQITQDDPLFTRWIQDITELLSAMINAIFHAFDIQEDGKYYGTQMDIVQQRSTYAITNRYRLIVSIEPTDRHRDKGQNSHI
jgi:hypothetical protein